MLKFNSVNDINASIIGAGKKAHSVIPAFIRSGINVSSIISRSISSAYDLAWQNNVSQYSDNILNSVSTEVNMVIISTPDDLIDDVIKEIAESEKDISGILFIHLSGSKSVAAFKPLQAKGAETGSLHIMQTFPSRMPVDLKGSYAAVEGRTDEVSKILNQLALKLELVPFILTPELKIFYHLMGTFASNFQIANFLGANMLEDHFPPEAPRTEDFLMPTAEKTLTNIKTKGIYQALSGAIERGDIHTVESHVEALKGTVELFFYYISGSLIILKAARIKNPSKTESYDKIEAFLRGQLKKICSAL